MGASNSLEDFLLILQPPVKIFLQAVKRFSRQKISFTACKSGFTRPVKTTGSTPLLQHVCCSAFLVSMI
jgi:hypothetical protein